VFGLHLRSSTLRFGLFRGAQTSCRQDRPAPPRDSARRRIPFPVLITTDRYDRVGV